MPRKKRLKSEEKPLRKVTPKEEIPQKNVTHKKIGIIYAVGKRKTSTARIRFYPQSSEEKEIFINQKKLKDYFPNFEYQKIVNEPLKNAGLENKFYITIKVKGGGKHSQAEACRHGIARVLVKYNSDYRKVLKAKGFLTRDSRMKERKKPGLKRARRAPQWQKR